ncbi:unnamed protein product [Mytilus edulis]|uniref:Reverse transcriptase domain-containing protein n=1 Tax=Mytilus edulis TaxID=6550 RepID=A0A8S3V7F7_MYTED|nr:unnamed protein product [Mytilus edulis]
MRCPDLGNVEMNNLFRDQMKNITEETRNTFTDRIIQTLDGFLEDKETITTIRREAKEKLELLVKVRVQQDLSFKRQNSYIRDSGDFINKIENLRPDRDCLLVSFDCTSMYTNMEFNELIHSVGRAYNSAVKDDYPIKLPSCETIKSLVATVLKNNYFEFNDRYFVQKIGASMGSHLKQRGYKDLEILRNCESALNIERPELLRFKQESDKQIPLVFVTKYHFSLGNINKALRKHYKKLVRNAKCRELFPKPPMVAYSRHRNLKEILTRSVVKA